MKKILFSFVLFIVQISVISQPSEFTWTNHHNINYISGAKDQKEQGSCNIFASVAAVEAMAQIYFNKSGTELNLSESYIHSSCGPTGGCDGAAASLTGSLNFFKTTGVIDESTLPFPSSPTYPPDCYYLGNCSIGTPSYCLKIPDYHKIIINTYNDLKKNIIDHGPLIAQMSNSFGCLYHSTPCSGISHTVLIVGWRTGTSNVQWLIKDSWPGDPSLDYHEFDIFNYNPNFYYIISDTLGVAISCTGSGCTNFNSRSYNDNDGDGFYNWGIGPKPSSLTNAPNKMDYDDHNPNIISLNNSYIPQVTPTITVSDDQICSSSDSLVLNDLPDGFTCTWSVSPSYYFSGATTGNGTIAKVNPLSTEIMKNCSITFTIYETGTSWTKQYVKNFIINGPNPSDISISVEDSYGQTPPQVAGIWLLCPYSTYYIYLNNNGNCSTNDYSWTTPSEWTQYYSYDNYVSIYTNDQDWGTVDVYAKTCCSTSSRVKIKTQNFSPDNCGEYLITYPNPASEKFTILFKDEFDLNAKEKSLEIFNSDYSLKYKLKEFLKENTIETSNWKDGYYYIRLRYNGKDFSYKIRISH